MIAPIGITVLVGDLPRRFGRAGARQVPARLDAVEFGPLHRASFRSPFLAAMTDNLMREVQRGDYVGRLAAEGAMMSILAELTRLAYRPARVRAIAPGIVTGTSINRMMPGYLQDIPANLQAIKRPAEPIDLARAAAFLLS